ncbi:hypothetical protein [Rhizobium sp. Root1203]|uniref:hypothetical protein n=1 Tax=Rhizobium sp. Root1203 TaxID=1736427 RepID=UPI000B061B57|nr:hypothetical protein [Rhizobium sp. Root1203]
MSDKDEEIFREGLGFFAGPELRPVALALINSYSANSMWVGCDCQPTERIKPRLIPVTNAGFRRDPDPPQPPLVPHSDVCEFNQDPVSATRVRASYKRRPRANGILKFRLARGPSEETQVRKPNTPVERINRSTPRPGLARMLCELLTEARVQEINPEDHFPTLERFNAMTGRIKAAATQIEIADGRFLNDWIAVGLSELPALKSRIAAENADDWGASRPHGILLCNFHDIRDREIFFNNDQISPVPVLGRIAVFGEREAANRHPYLAICLIGKPDAKSSYPAVLRAYAHPCMNWAKWALTDSILERETIDAIQRCRFGLSNRDIQIRLTKPLFDMNVNMEGETQPACIPDFLIEVLSRPLSRTVVIETMGYTDTRYRNRKLRLKDYFTAIDLRRSDKLARLIHHDPSQFGSEDEAKREFYKSLRDDIISINNGTDQF